jgi:hypothetical protein
MYAVVSGRYCQQRSLDRRQGAACLALRGEQEVLVLPARCSQEREWGVERWTRIPLLLFLAYLGPARR